MMQLYRISQAGCLLYLCSLSVLDMRSRTLPVWLLAVGGLLACSFQMHNNDLPFLLIAAGGATGIIFLAVSKITEESFGYGDSILIGVLGIYLGFWNLLSLLMISFLLAAAAAMLILMRRNFSRKTRLPFVPFLGIGYAFTLLLGGF